MVKLKGPIMSLEAHGSIGKILTFSERGSGSQTRKYTKPIKAPSAKQRAQRRLTEFLVAQWQNMTEIQKDVYEDAAKATGKQISGYHYFLSVAQKDLLTNTGMLAYWHCNVIDANRVLDLSGQGHHATLKPTPPGDAPILAASRSSRFSNALSFDGVNDYAEAPNEIIPASSDFFLEAWIYCNGEKAGDTDRRACAFGSASFVVTTQGVLFRVNPDTGNLRVTIANGTTSKDMILIYDIVTTNKQKWYHVGVTYDHSETKAYPILNGVRQAGQVIAYANTSLKFRLGHSNNLHDQESYWYGKVDEVCIYNRLLSAAEIYTRYNFAIKKT